MRNLICLILICLPLLASSQGEKHDLHDAENLLKYWLEAQLDYNKIPGANFAFVEDQDVTWQLSLGDANPNKSLLSQPNTLYSICSISKLFTSISIMQLRDAGKLSLEDKIQDVLPWYDLPQQYEESGPVTIRSLLTHSSGLPRESNHPYWTGPDFPFPKSSDVKSELSNQESLYPASTYFQYSNLGMTILGSVIEEVSGMTYDEYINENILTPLAMADTRTYLPKEKWGSQLSVGYGSRARSGERELIEMFQANGIKAAAGFSSSVMDLAKFASWNFDTRDKSNDVLRSSTIKEMQRVHFMDPSWDTSWGLGYSVFENNGATLVGHGGSCPGYRTQLIMNPAKKSAVVVMFNAMVSTYGFVKGINGVFSKAYNAKVVESEIDLNAYEGIYNAQPWGSEELIVPWYGNLAMLYLPADNIAGAMTLYKHVEGDTFRRMRDDETLGETVVFERDVNGKVSRYKQHNNYTNKLR